MLLIRVRLAFWVVLAFPLLFLCLQAALMAVAVLGLGIAKGLPASDVAPEFLQCLGFLLLVSVPTAFVKGRLEKVGEDEAAEVTRRGAEKMRERAKESVERLRNLFAKQEAERISVGGSDDELLMLN